MSCCKNWCRATKDPWGVMEQQPDGSVWGGLQKGATGWRRAENWRIRRQLKAKRGWEQQQGSKLKNSRGPCRGVCGCLGTNVGGSLGSGWKFRGKEQPVGQEKGQSGFNPGEIPSPSPRSSLPAIQRHCAPRFLLWAVAHHNVSARFSRVSALSSRQSATLIAPAAPPVCVFTTRHIWTS